MFNVPNKITISRVLLIPIFVILMVVDFPWGEVSLNGISIPVEELIAAVIFVVASTTDWIDGYYARKYQLVTNFGKFLDPLADKLLVTAALVVLVGLGAAPSWIVIIILSREFAVTGLRLILANEGEVVAANMLGKIKTWTQIIAVTALLMKNWPFALWHIPFADIALWVAVFFTIWSGLDYFIKNKHAFQG